MELVVFDLDGTLLNESSQISSYTSETLKLLSERGIAYTVATGRTLHGARAILDGHGFKLPQAYKNGVMIWHPEQQRLSSEALVTPGELRHVVNSALEAEVTPFVFTLGDSDASYVYHSPLQSDVERGLIKYFGVAEKLVALPLDELPNSASVTHVNCIGESEKIEEVYRSVNDEPNLVAYSGYALEGKQWRWLDVHHSDASKGGAVRLLKDMLGLERVICFGDSDNDLSMFNAADESYAPENAKERIKSAATAVIGHHDDEGIAHFLRERFDLANG